MVHKEMVGKEDICYCCTLVSMALISPLVVVVVALLDAGTSLALVYDTMMESATRDLDIKGRRNVNNDKQIKPSNSGKKDESAKQSNKIVLIGDSLLKHINEEQLSRNRVEKVRSSTLADATNHINAMSLKDVDKIILHVGSNDIANNRKSEDVAEDIMNLAQQTKSNMKPANKIIISGILPRGNTDMNKKIKEVNLKVKSYVDNQDGIVFVDHKKLYGAKKYYHVDNVHLNDIGTEVLASNIINAMRNKPRAENRLSSDRQQRYNTKRQITQNCSTGSTSHHNNNKRQTTRNTLDNSHKDNKEMEITRTEMTGHEQRAM
uniref:Uncharacterized protein LOC102808526 n=1 Tax=Saccoglossus kowalevskii TaxID=10224 RepID=A0ABM0MB12_SACKO|nr:PREDICTED: uncharacterized protein LOC102808526 [Saccoglossus kowalevskii]